MTQEPTIKSLLSELETMGFKISKSNTKVNGKSTYNVSGYPGLFSKIGLMRLAGY